jgi:CBS domain-containing protein
VRSAPVLDGGRLAGVVTRRDLLRVISRHDRLVESEVRHRLGRYADPARWRVSVVEGQVEVLDDLDDDEDRHVIRVLAEAVPGVVRVRVTKAEHAADHG